MFRKGAADLKNFRWALSKRRISVVVDSSLNTISYSRIERTREQ